MVIVDSSVWIDFFGGIENDATLWILRGENHQLLALTDLNLCELLQGMRQDSAASRTLQWLQRVEVLRAGGQDIAVRAAHNYRHLRRKGVTVYSTIDCLIATFCIQNNHSLLHRDRDFDPFEQHLGLRVIHPPPRQLQ